MLVMNGSHSTLKSVYFYLLTYSINIV